MKVKLISLITSIVFLGIVSFIFALDPNLVKNKETSKTSKNKKGILILKMTEQNLDEKIAKFNMMIQDLTQKLVLIQATVRYTPGQTNFSYGTDDKTNDTYIELESYAFIPASLSSGKSVGSRFKSIKLYHKDGVLQKILSSISEENFKDNTRYKSSVLDTTIDYLNEDEVYTDAIKINDIKVTNKVNSQPVHTLELTFMENSLANAMRIDFKRDFYVPHLKYFEKMLRYTFEYQKKYGTDTDSMALENLKKSLKY